ncbi:LysE family translocator [Roseomonas rosulenta]|uniref:LysE family translocator n=1 Tax=Roseomonas rosulenta TaxID=2748667 RepID=UPI0018DEFE80|nr:LysE family translocator [Roseomonas rosulenta]
MDHLALLGFAIAMSVTPGPNVLMVAAGAANAGVRATVPHMMGIAVGFGAMLLIVGLGLAAPFAAAPWLHTALKCGGAAWLLLLAWKIARAGAPGEGPPRPPLGFIGAALFQWVNPKAWMIALAAIPTFTTPDGDILREALLVAGAFALVGFPCTLVWALLGAGASRLLRTDRALRGFNIAMAVLLVASLIPAFV